MKLKAVRIKNFRCYTQEFLISFDELTCIIARNDVGKSSILEALEAFFNLEKLDAEDRSLGVPSNSPIEITCIFELVNPTLVIDTDAIVNPHAEYLLNSQGELEIRKVFSGAQPKFEEVYVQAVHPTAPSLHDLFDLTIVQLRRRAQDLGVDLQNVNQTIKSAIRQAIWASVHADALGLQVSALAVKSTIWKSLLNSLPLFQLFRSDRPSSDQDAEAQDPIKFAIKEALNSQQAQLTLIEDRVREQIEQVTNATIAKIQEMDPGLASELNPVFSSFNWSKVFSVSLTADNQVPLNKRGSGVRRLFLINFFRARVEQLAEDRGAPDTILAIEEPETSQHPNNQLILLEALLDLSQSPSTQVILTTHNPLLVRKLNKDFLRFIEIDNNRLRSVAPNDDESILRLKETLGILANHDVCVFVGVEGPNDIEFLNRISTVLSATEVDIPNLSIAERQGRLVYIPMGGSTLELWTSRLEGLSIPEIHIMDRDVVPPGRAHYQAAADEMNQRENVFAFITTGREMENVLHPDAIREEYGLGPVQIDLFDDVPTLVAELTHNASGAETLWQDLEEDKKSKKISKAKKRLNRAVVDKMTPQRLTATDVAGDVRIWLRKIGEYL